MNATRKVGFEASPTRVRTRSCFASRTSHLFHRSLGKSATVQTRRRVIKRGESIWAIVDRHGSITTVGQPVKGSFVFPVFPSTGGSILGRGFTFNIHEVVPVRVEHLVGSLHPFDSEFSCSRRRLWCNVFTSSKRFCV